MRLEMELSAMHEMHQQKLKSLDATKAAADATEQQLKLHAESMEHAIDGVSKKYVASRTELQAVKAALQ